MIYLKNTTDKQTFYIIRNTSGSEVWDLTSLDVEYTENGEYSILPPSGYDGLSSVKVTVNVDSGGSYDEGYNDGIADQKAKLTSTTFTENGTFNREDGWNSVTVDVDTQTPYDNGFADGEEAQKAKLSSLNVTANGTYSREDGWNEVIVNVESGEVTKTVQDLIDEGYANLVTGTYGDYIEILDTCPYTFNQVIDVAEVARNEKQLTEGTNNIIVWNQTLPDGWSQSDIKSIYEGETLNFDPRGEMLWALYDVDSLNIIFAGGRYQASDYPWGSYHSEGIFAPRYNIPKEAEYAQKGWRNTPRNVNVTLTGNYSSVSQVSFTQMKTTENLTLNTQVYSCQDTTGMFEGCTGLKNLVINGEFHWDTWRLCHNVFDGCNSLTSIPYTTEWDRTDSRNTIYPRFDSVRGSANCRHLFNAPALESIGPILNMNAISLNGCTADGQTQAALSDALFHCPVLTDVRIINLNNNDWDFTDENGFVYIPLMDATSAEYLLNNVADVTSQGGHTVTLPANGTISSTAIANAESKGWTVVLVNNNCNVSFCPVGWDGEDVKQVQKHIDDSATDGTYLKLHFEQQLFPNKERLQAAAGVFDGSGGMNLANSPTTRWAFIPYVDTSAVTNMNYMFFGMVNLETIPLLNTSAATSMEHMFDMTNPISGSPYMTIGQYDALPTLKYVPSIDTSNVTSTAFMFNGCVNLGGLDYPRMSFDLSNCTTTEGMFKDCWYMLKVPTLTNTGNVTNWSRTFYMCGHYFGSVNTLTLDTSSATNMTEMFYGCENLQHLSELDCTNVVNVTRMFDGVFHLAEFGGCKNLGNAFGGTSAAAHTLDLSAALDADSTPTTAIHNVLSKLGTTTVSDAVVKFDAACYNLADPADIADATAKGWSVVSV